MKRIVYLPAAEQDVLEILSIIAEDHPPASLAYNRRIRTAVTRLADYPLSAPSRERVAQGLRGLSVGRHIAYYRVTQEEVVIVRVLHAARDAGAADFAVSS